MLERFRVDREEVEVAGDDRLGAAGSDVRLGGARRIVATSALRSSAQVLPSVSARIGLSVAISVDQ